MTIRPAILPIYHVGDDSYEDASGRTRVIEESGGLTLNANCRAAYAISSQHSIGLSLGFPLVTRDARPDGLTREYVAGIEYVVGI